MSKISTRTYQRRIAALKQLVEQMQWCHPMYNGSPSCANCGNQQHIGCATGCAAAKVTGDRGGQ